MLLLHVDVSGIYALTADLAASAKAIDDAIPEGLNSAGRDMRIRIIESAAASFEIVSSIVAGAITEQTATAMDFNYTLTANGARIPYVKWNTQHDEKVCPICAPLDGKIFREDESERLRYPHYGCRCTLDPLDVGGAIMVEAPRHLATAMDDAAARITDAAIKALRP